MANMGILGSVGGVFRQLLGRSSRTPKTARQSLTSSPDDAWTAEDHVDPPSVSEPVIDPWEVKGVQEAAAPVDASPKPQEERSTTAASNEPDHQPQAPPPLRPIEPEIWSNTSARLPNPIGQPPPVQFEISPSANSGAPSVELPQAQAPKFRLGEPIGKQAGTDTAGLNEESIDEALDEDLESVLGVSEHSITDSLILGEVPEADQGRFGDGLSDMDLDGPPSQLRETNVDEDWDYDIADGQNFESFAMEAFEAEDHEHDIGLWTYDDEARQTPWEIDLDDDQIDVRTAREKAAHILSRLELDSWSERECALGYLSELLEHLKHPSTFRALVRLADDVGTFESLHAAVELRRVWAQRPEWWCRRHRGEVISIPKGWSALTWTLANRICVARGEYPPETMIEDHWLDEWMMLPPGASGYISFPAFVGEKISNVEAELLHVGLQAVLPSESPY